MIAIFQTTTEFSYGVQTGRNSLKNAPIGLIIAEMESRIFLQKFAYEATSIKNGIRVFAYDAMRYEITGSRGFGSICTCNATRFDQTVFVYDVPAQWFHLSPLLLRNDIQVSV